jgi:hypothetical protein
MSVESLFPEGRERFELGSCGWSRVLGLDAVGGSPYCDFAHEGGVRVASRCSPGSAKPRQPSSSNSPRTIMVGSKETRIANRSVYAALGGAGELVAMVSSAATAASTNGIVGQHRDSWYRPGRGLPGCHISLIHSRKPRTARHPDYGGFEALPLITHRTTLAPDRVGGGCRGGAHRWLVPGLPEPLRFRLPCRSCEFNSCVALDRPLSLRDLGL